MARNNKSFTQLRSILACFLIIVAMVITGCSKEEDPAPEDDQAKIIKEVIGLYQADGVYNRVGFDDKLVAIGKNSSGEIEISGTEFPAFKITNLFIGYKSGTDPNEYTVFGKAVGPNDGNITFTFPQKEVMVVVEIKIDDTTKRTLTLTGTKQE